MFSFRHFANYARLPARIRARHAALALALGAMPALACRIVAQVDMPRGNFRTTALSQLSARTQVLCIGSSHVVLGVRPSLYPCRWVNLCTFALSYDAARRVVMADLSRAPGARVAVVETDELMANVAMLARLKGDLRPLLELGVGPVEVSAASGPRDPLERAHLLLRSSLYPIFMMPRLTPYEFANRTTDVGSDAWEPGYVFEPARIGPRFDPRVESRQLNEGIRPDASGEIAAFVAIVRALRAHRVKVLLVRLPHHSSYPASCPQPLRDRYRQLLEVSRANFGRDGGVTLCDLEAAPGFGDDDFRDMDHLNQNGAVKLERVLWPRVQQLLATPD
jgi:hypothetical protein